MRDIMVCYFIFGLYYGCYIPDDWRWLVNLLDAVAVLYVLFRWWRWR